MPVEAFQTDKIYVPPITGTFIRTHSEPIHTQDATKRTIDTLDAKYEKVNLPEVIKNTCRHVSSMEQSKLLLLLTKYQALFNGTLGDFDTDPVKFNLQLGEKTAMESHIQCHKARRISSRTKLIDCVR